ncbi:MAG: hypothetical protein ABIF71_07645 [Planctomycetota bacterium]
MKVANVFIGPACDKKNSLMRHERLTVSGGSGAAFDTIANLGYITSVFHAYAYTGDVKHKQWVLEYVDSWNELAEKNKGIFPFVVSSTDRSIPAEWYKEVEGGFAYDNWGTVTTIRGMQGWANALGILCKGDPKYFRGINSFIDSMCSWSPKFVPASHYRAKGWARDQEPWWVPFLVDRPYAATFTDDAAERIKKYYRDSTGTERGVLQWAMFTYFGEGGPGLAEAPFIRKRQVADEQYAKVQAITSLPQIGDDMTAFTSMHLTGMGYADGALFGLYDNGRCGGVTNASVRFFKEDRT